MRPIFRDREDFSGGHTLTDATVAALDASATLIVLCSPVAASRPAVNEEVRLFRSRHPDRPVIPVIVDGTWPDNFPPALRFELAADGSVTDRPTTILGPDLRDAADGKTLGLAKTIAGLTGLGADDLFRRAERARRRQTRIWGAVAGFCLLLAVLATGSTVYAWQQLKTNEAFLSATLKTATDIVNTAVAQAEKYRVPRAATLELLNKAEGLFDNMARYGRPTPELQFQKASMLIQFARNYAALGDTNKERSRADEAYRLLAGLAAAKPDDPNYQFALAAAYDEVGNVQVAQGDLAGALKSYRDSLAIRQRSAQSDPGNADWQRVLSVSYNKVGNVQVEQGDLAAALKSYRDSLAITERLAQTDPGNAGWQHDLSVSHGNVGNVELVQGDLAGALKSYRDSLAIVERLAQSDPGNADWQCDQEQATSHEPCGYRARTCVYSPSAERGSSNRFTGSRRVFLLRGAARRRKRQTHCSAILRRAHRREVAARAGKNVRVDDLARGTELVHPRSGQVARELRAGRQASPDAAGIPAEGAARFNCGGRGNRIRLPSSCRTRSPWFDRDHSDYEFRYLSATGAERQASAHTSRCRSQPRAKRLPRVRHLQPRADCLASR